MSMMDTTPLADLAAQLHELFRSLIAAGFTRSEALRLTAYLALGGEQTPPQ